MRMTINKIPHFDPFSFGTTLSKSAIGFDNVFKKLQEVSDHLPKIPTYPPYNIVKVDDTKYIIEIAVAGFGQQDIEIELQDGTLTVKGNLESKEANDYLFKGIADRAFTRSFTLAETVQVKNADLLNGMLKIWLERFVPEEKKPRKIPINSDKEDGSTKQFLTEKYGK